MDGAASRAVVTSVGDAQHLIRYGIVVVVIVDTPSSGTEDAKILKRYSIVATGAVLNTPAIGTEIAQLKG